MFGYEQEQECFIQLPSFRHEAMPMQIRAISGTQELMDSIRLLRGEGTYENKIGSNGIDKSGMIK
jgi:hypothetical protein